MKACNKCGVMTDDFAPDKRNKDGLQGRCRTCQNKQGAAYRKTDKSKEYKRKHSREYMGAYTKERRQTIRGNLQLRFFDITHRCKKRKDYTDKGVKNKFRNFEHFRSYVVEVLKVDPRGLVCHRINDAGHYEEDNIQFITREEHIKIHRIWNANENKNVDQ